jgi:proton-coupled amino acid transporter
MHQANTLLYPSLAATTPLLDSGSWETADFSTSSTYNSTDYFSPRKKTETLDYDGPLTADDDDATGTDTSPDGVEPKTSASQTFIHLLKGYLGPGCLSLPWALSQVGFVGGTFAVVVMSVWSSYNCMTIVKIKRYIERVNIHNNTVNETESTSQTYSLASSALTYPNVGEWAYGDNFAKFVSGCICSQQLAICTVFFSFIGENIYAVCELVPKLIPSVFYSHIGVMTVALPFVMGLSFIPSLNALTPIMAAGTFLLFAGFGVLSYIIAIEWEDRPTEPVEIQWKSAPLALCAILYSYEGICLILPIESSMAEPRKFKKVFWYAMASIALILATVSNVCVYAFGEVTNGSITAFLLEKYEDDNTVILFVMIANTAVSLSVLFTYPIQIFPVIEILGPEFPRFWSKLMGGPDIGLADDENEHDLTGFEPMPPLPEHDVADHDTDFDNFIDLSNRDDFVNENKQAGVVEQQPQDWLGLRSSYMSNITEVFPQWSGQSCNLILRMLLVVLTFLVAVVVPNVQALISLAGAIAGSSSALLIPPMLELALIEHLEATSNEMSAASSSPRPLRSLSAQQPGFMWKLGGHNLSGKHWKKKLRCYILFWLGFIFFLIGTYASFSNIVMIWIGKG